MTNPMPTTEETKLPWTAPKVSKAEINIDTAAGVTSGVDGTISAGPSL